VEIVIKNNVVELERLNEQIELFWDENKLDPAKLCHISLCLEEIITNIIKYGYSDNSEHEIKINVNLNGGEKIELEVIDDGEEFNPFDHPEPDTSLALEHRDIGGLGIHLVRNFMDEYNYKRQNNLNSIVMIKNIA